MPKKTHSISGQKALVKYLDKHAEPIAKEQAFSLNDSFQHCIVIPCYDETAAFAKRLVESPLWAENILVIVVINQSNSEPTLSSNRVLWDYFQTFETNLLGDNICLAKHVHSAFLVVDYFSPSHAMAKHAGVGLARKIGCDIAVKLIHEKTLSTQWVYSTDADAKLPSNYFSTINTETSCSAVVFQHQHIAAGAPTDIYNATKLYEQAIAYYTAGLARAQSPYAFPTIGSCLCVHAESYCLARGFPRKSAGEDFYLLNKLAKLNGVHIEPSITVQLAARVSTRNPFGTGPAVQAILEHNWDLNTYPYYAPPVFEELRLLHRYMFQIQTHPERLKDKNTSSDIPNLSLASTEALTALQFNQFCGHVIKQKLDGARLCKAWADWFDALKTLRFIHILQQNHYPAQPLAQSLNHCGFHPK